MKRLIFCALVSAASGICEAQETGTQTEGGTSATTTPGQTSSGSGKGSYLYYGQPAIEDNSFLIEEAINQEAGVIQHIFTTAYADGDIVYSYTQELPLRNDRHQLSFGLSYASLKKPETMTAIAQSNFVSSGMGDFFVNYRSMLWDKNDWAIVIPRLSLIIPTGNARYQLGAGAWGGQFNLAITKRLSRQLVMHYNAGYTYYSGSDYYRYDKDLNPSLTYERDVEIANIGASAVWLVHPKVNLLLEYVSNFEEEILDDASIICQHNLTLNPGIRMAFDIGKVQVVPGVGVPFNFENGQYSAMGAFLYLSIEPAYSSND